MLYLGAIPSFGRARENSHIETSFDVELAKMDMKYLRSLLLGRETDEEELIEPPLANELGWEQVDSICGCRNEYERLFLLHPGQERGEDPGSRTGRPFLHPDYSRLDLVYPENGRGDHF